MCGFLAESKTKVSDQELLTRAERLQHRGPDQTISSFGSEARFVFHRLSIMDLSDKGRQPFTHPEMKVVCNGEIYNYKLIKKEMTELSSEMLDAIQKMKKNAS